MSSKKADPGKITGMNLSVSLSDDDVEFLDALVRLHGYESRTAIIHQAIRLLRASELGREYALAWQEWQASGREAAWESAVGDGELLH